MNGMRSDTTGMQLDRREFVRTTAVAGAGLALGLQARALDGQAGKDELAVAMIGPGSQGRNLITKCLKIPGIRFVAVCDIWPYHRQYAANILKKYDQIVTTYEDYREMLAKEKNLDAVIVATPDWVHSEQTVACLEAGKHVYCEKPLTHTIEEGFDILAAVKKSGKKFQVGTQRRSSLLYQKAKEIYESGVLGKVHYARAFWYRNSPETFPAWRYDIPGDSTPDNTDYEKFLGTAPKTDFDKQRYFQWRLYWDYSGGISTDLLVHQTDAIHMITGRTHCKSVMCNGGIHCWTEDDREVPDTVTAAFEYPDHFHINYSAMFRNSHYRYGEQLFGSEGTMEIMGLTDLYVYPEKYRGVPEHVAARPEIHIRSRKDLGQGNPTDAHLKNFIDAIKGTAELNCPVQTGHEAAVTGHLATMSYRKEKKVFWDQENQRYYFG